MSEIRVGDWVYGENNDLGGGESVFKCKGFEDGLIAESKETLWFPEYCHRLTPMEPGEAKVGERVVTIVSEGMEWEPPVGTISRVLKVHDDCVTIESHMKEGSYLHIEKLARLPDCAQGKEEPAGQTGSIDATIDASENILVDDEYPNLPISIRCDPVPLSEPRNTNYEMPLPCPHPEWEGVWVQGGISPFKVTWEDGDFWCRLIRPGLGMAPRESWQGPEGWTQIEPAPYASRQGPKMDRPQKHGGIKTPIDTGW